jgi:uncharacterized protein YceK
MRYRTGAVLGLLTAAILSGGCGTVANTAWLIPEEGGKRPYGGIRIDYDKARNPPTSFPNADDRLQQFVFALDLPFSLVGDTLTLPYVLAYDMGLFGRRLMNLGGDAYQEAVSRMPAKVQDPPGETNTIASPRSPTGDP